MSEESFWQWMLDPEKRKELYNFTIGTIVPICLTIVFTWFTIPPSSRSLWLVIIGGSALVFVIVFFFVTNYNEFKDQKKDLLVPIAVNIIKESESENISMKNGIAALLKDEQKKGVQKFSENKLIVPFEWMLSFGKLKEPDSEDDKEGMKNSASEFQVLKERIDEMVRQIDMIKSESKNKRIYVFYHGPLALAFYLGKSLQNKSFYIGKWMNDSYKLLKTKDGHPLKVDSYELKKLKVNPENYVEVEKKENPESENVNPYAFNFHVAIGHHGNLESYKWYFVLDEKEVNAKYDFFIKRKGEDSTLTDIKLEEYADYAVAISNEIKKICESSGRCDIINLFYNGPVEVAILMGYLLKPPPAIVVYHYTNLGFYYSVLMLSKD